MNNILNSLFLENPYIPEQIYDFCNQLPDFRQAERDYLEATAVLRQRLGQEFDRFEEVLNWHLAQYSKAYYLFGLHLRQEVLSALGQAG